MGLHVNRLLALETPVAVGHAAIAGDPRAELAAQFIPAGARVLDLGGGGALERHLPHGCSYRGVARGRRKAAGAIAGDDFPTQAAAQSDIIVMLGALDRVADLESLFTHLRFARRDVILSHCFERAPGFCDLTLRADRYGFRIECTAPVEGGEMLLRLTPTARVAPLAPCRIAVVDDGGHDFGARLGRQMLDALLPGEAEVDRLAFTGLERARAHYDLVVLGAGDGLPLPLCEDALLDLVGRSKAAIGIFGTQYRELIPRPALERLIDRLDCWFARHEDDVLMYGRGRGNVVHLGDWLIDRFPVAQADDDAPLEISGAMAPDLALDRAIETIQRHKQVYATQAEPLLCALASADLVAFSDAPAGPVPGLASGQFRSMLVDIFGRTFPQRQFFLVDRDAVARYKARVHRNVALLRARIEAALRNVTAAGA